MRAIIMCLENFDNSLIAWWRLDNSSAVGENDTFVYDWSGNGNNGSVINVTWNESGKFGGTESFDGDGDYVDLGSSAIATENIASTFSRLV